MSIRYQKSLSWMGWLSLGLLLGTSPAAGGASALEQAWTNPPINARLRAYWWWLNGNVTKAAITRDLEEMKAKGFGGALICDAGGADQDGNDRVPHGPTFLYARVAGALPTYPARGRSAWARDEPEHPERLEPRRPDGKGGGCGQEVGVVGNRSAWSGGGKIGAAQARFPRPVLSRPVCAPPTGSSLEPSHQPIQNWQQKAVYQHAATSPRRTPPRCSRTSPPNRAKRTQRQVDVLDLTASWAPDGVLRLGRAGGRLAEYCASAAPWATMPTSRPAAKAGTACAWTPWMRRLSSATGTRSSNR